MIHGRLTVLLVILGASACAEASSEGASDDGVTIEQGRTAEGAETYAETSAPSSPRHDAATPIPVVTPDGGSTPQGGTCAPSTKRACTEGNGTGEQTCFPDGSQYGACVIQACASGFDLSNGKCCATPTVTGSASGAEMPSVSVVNGNLQVVTSNGSGTYGGTPRTSTISFTVASLTGGSCAQPSGLSVVNNELRLTCTANGGYGGATTTTAFRLNGVALTASPAAIAGNLTKIQGNGNQLTVTASQAVYNGTQSRTMTITLRAACP